MKTLQIRAKTWGLVGFIFLIIIAKPLMPFISIRVIFAALFILWAVTFYFKKVSLKNELITDGVWWIPYFLVTGLGVLAFSEKYNVILTEQNWEKFFQFAFLLIICAILFFWEWPPWLDKNKTLITKGKRVLLAYIFFILGLVIWLYGGVCLLNVALDHSQSIAHDCHVTDKVTIGHGKAAEKEHIIFIKPWNKRLKIYSFYVSNQDFQQISTNSTVVRVWTKEGFFHFEWVAGVKILSLNK